MNPVNLYNPGKISFGPGTIDSLVSDYISIGKKRIYIISLEAVTEKLKGRINKLKDAGIEVKINNSLTAEPSIKDFNRLCREADEFGPDSVAGIGGGSVMDVAKVVAAFTGTGLSIESFIGSGLIRSRNTHLVCVPTTSGTGSEVSPNSILLDEETGAKKGIISPLLIPDTAYVDPELTIGLPREITAYTGIDALTHCIEAYTNKFAHPIIDMYALEGIKLIYNNLKKAYLNGDDLEARTGLALGSLYGGICLGPLNTAAVHALAYPLGSDYKVPHGLSNAVLLPYVMEFNIVSESYLKYAEIANSIGPRRKGPSELVAKQSVKLIKELLDDCGIPSTMKELGVTVDSLDKMADAAAGIERLLKNNPRDINRDDILEIYRKAF